MDYTRLVAYRLRMASRPGAGFGLGNEVYFGDPAKRWPATPIDGNPTYQAVATGFPESYGVMGSDWRAVEVA